MNHKKIFACVMSFFIAGIAYAGDKLVLQNGLNGYDKCEDTYLNSKKPSGNFNASDTLLSGF